MRCEPMSWIRDRHRRHDCALFAPSEPKSDLNIDMNDNDIRVALSEEIARGLMEDFIGTDLNCRGEIDRDMERLLTIAPRAGHVQAPLRDGETTIKARRRGGKLDFDIMVGLRQNRSHDAVGSGRLPARQHNHARPGPDLLDQGQGHQRRRQEFFVPSAINETGRRSFRHHYHVVKGRIEKCISYGSPHRCS